MNLTEFREDLFARGARLGFTDLELYFHSTERFSTNIFQGEIDKYAISVEGGASLRAIHSGRMGNAYTERIDRSSIDILLEGARAGALVSDVAETPPIFAGSPAYEEVNLFSEALAAVTPEQQIELARAMEAECFRLDRRVTAVNYCLMESQRTERLMANTRGLAVSERGNAAFVYLSAVVRDGDDVKSAARFMLTRDVDRLKAPLLAAEVVEEALSCLGAEQAESRNYPVLLRHTAAARLLAAFGGIFSAENVQKGKSLLRNRVGQRIASEIVTIIDDPFMPEGAESRAFDSEGVASRRLRVVDGGVLRSLLYNLRSAQADGAVSTGHGYRASYKGAIGTAPSNMFIRPGHRSLREMVEATEDGLLITSLQGLHSGANPISGDFSLAAHGYHVQGGKIRRPVHQITVAGNLFELLGAIEEVGGDLEFDMPGGGYVGSPTLKIRNLSVGGR